VTDSVRWVMQTTDDLAQVGEEKAKRTLKKKQRWRAPKEGFN
jgi:hypothetical protein